MLKRTEKKAAKGFRLWDTDPREEDCVAAAVERQARRSLSRARAFAIVCYTDPGRGLVFRFTGDVHCENPPAETIAVRDFGQTHNKAIQLNQFD